MMIKEQYAVEKEYRIARNIFMYMLNKSLIDGQEFAQIDTKLRQIYNPIIGGLLSQ